MGDSVDLVSRSLGSKAVVLLAVSAIACHGTRSADGWVVSVHSVQPAPPLPSAPPPEGAAPEQVLAPYDPAAVAAYLQAPDPRPQLASPGTLLWARGDLDGQPAQLWLYVPSEVQGGGTYLVPPGQGQLLLGQPITYVAADPIAHVRLSEDFFTATIDLETGWPQFDEKRRGRENLQLQGELRSGDELTAGSLPDEVRYVSNEQLSKPKVLPYRHGEEPPEGYRLESSPRWGLAALGLGVFALGYGAPVGIAAGLGFPDRSKVIAIPVVGPLVIYHRFLTHEDGCCAMGLFGLLVVTQALVGASFLQVGGLALMGAGPFQKKHRWVREPNWLSLLPLHHPEAQGVQVKMLF